MRTPTLALLVLAATAPLASQVPTRAALIAGAAPRSADPPAARGEFGTPSAGVPSTSVGAGRPAGGEGAVGVRLATGALGAAVGLAGGAVAAYGLLRHRGCGDDPGLCEAVRGAAIGAVVGAGLGAAVPALGSACGFGRRASVGLVGAALGALAGYVVVARTAAAALTVPLGAVGGGVAGASRC